MADRVYSIPLAGGTATRTEATHADATVGRLVMVLAAPATASEVQDVLGLLAADITAKPGDYAGDRNRIYTISTGWSWRDVWAYGTVQSPRGPFLRVDDYVTVPMPDQWRPATHASVSTGEAIFIVPFSATAAQLAVAVAAMRVEATSNPAKYGS